MKKLSFVFGHNGVGVARPVLLGCLFAGALAAGACGSSDAPSDTSEPTMELVVAPLEFPQIADATYTITMYADLDGDGAEDEMWTVSGITSSGTGGVNGGLTYVGACFDDNTTGPTTNRVEVTLDEIVDDNGDTVSPLPPPQSQEFDCEEGTDARVPFDITVMLSARQGFTDITVDLVEVECSAKVECVESLLQDPATGERGWSMVTGLSCKGGDANESSTFVGFQGEICCDGQTPCTTITTDPATGEAVVQAPPGYGVLIEQAYQNTTNFEGSEYFNTAWRIDDGNVTSCIFHGWGWMNTDGSVEYVEGNPGISFDLTLDDANNTCTGGVSAAYSNAYCGDGEAVGDEECDGEATCDPNCTFQSCGNGYVSVDGGGTPEECDDGTNAGGDSQCRPDCTAPTCGDTIIDTDPAYGETCDDGPSGSATCDPNCTAPSCGNSYVGNDEFGAPEDCDDGPANADADSQCRTDCSDPECGDFITDTDPAYGETCDEGPSGNATCDPVVCTAPSCGNGYQGLDEFGAAEECDDGVANGNGDSQCRPDCTLPTCGDNVPDTQAPYNEECDLGAGNNDVSGGADSACCTTLCEDGTVVDGGAFGTDTCEPTP